MNKLGYFFAGIVAGAVALGAAAFLMDGTDDTPLDSNLDEDSEPEEEPDPEGESGSECATK